MIFSPVVLGNWYVRIIFLPVWPRGVRKWLRSPCEHETNPQMCDSHAWCAWDFVGLQYSPVILFVYMWSMAVPNHGPILTDTPLTCLTHLTHQTWLPRKKPDAQLLNPEGECYFSFLKSFRKSVIEKNPPWCVRNTVMWSKTRCVDKNCCKNCFHVMTFTAYMFYSQCL